MQSDSDSPQHLPMRNSTINFLVILLFRPQYGLRNITLQGTHSHPRGRKTSQFLIKRSSLNSAIQLHCLPLRYVLSIVLAVYGPGVHCVRAMYKNLGLFQQPLVLLCSLSQLHSALKWHQWADSVRILACSYVLLN